MRLEGMYLIRFLHGVWNLYSRKQLSKCLFTTRLCCGVKHLSTRVIHEGKCDLYFLTASMLECLFFVQSDIFLLSYLVREIEVYLEDLGNN